MNSGILLKNAGLKTIMTVLFFMIYESVRFQYDPKAVVEVPVTGVGEFRPAVEMFLKRLEMVLSVEERGLLVKDREIVSPEGRFRKWMGGQDYFAKLVVASENGVGAKEWRRKPFSVSPVEVLVNSFLDDANLHQVLSTGGFCAERVIHASEAHVMYTAVENIRNIWGLSLWVEGKWVKQSDYSSGEFEKQVSSFEDCVMACDDEKVVGIYRSASVQASDIDKGVCAFVEGGLVRCGHLRYASRERSFCVLLIPATPLDVVLRVRRSLLDKYVLGGFDVHNSYKKFDLLLTEKR